MGVVIISCGRNYKIGSTIAGVFVTVHFDEPHWYKFEVNGIPTRF